MVCQVISVMSDSVTLWTVACQAPLSMGFFRQKYWRGLPFPSPGNLPVSGLKFPSLTSPALASGFFTTGASLIAQLVRNPMQEHCRRLQFDSWVRKICWRRDRIPTPVFLGFPCGLAGKESSCNTEDLGSIPGLGRSLGEEKGYTF